ncbi:hypothetical protein H0H93_010558, partial [Arthromyces matolae]
TDDGSNPSFFRHFGDAGGSSNNRGDISMEVDFSALTTGQSGVFDARLGFNATDTYMSHHGGDTSMQGFIDPSSFLAMLGGEPLSDKPFLPPFDSYSPSGGGDGGTYSPNVQSTSASAVGFEVSGQASGIPEADLAILTQIWNQKLA